MNIGNFYFIDNSYFLDFPDPKLMQNEKGNIMSGRPYFLAFQDVSSGLYWAVPVSRQYCKYKAEYDRTLARRNKCDTIGFAQVLGINNAFLIQNMCPITIDYITVPYNDSKANIPVRIDKRRESEIISKAKKIHALYKLGKNFILPDVGLIEKVLLAKK